jgi:hypothetical protein
LSSLTLAWQVAALHILCERQRVRYWESHAHRKESIPAMLMDVYRQERHLLMQELEYRAQGAIPEPKSSKKKFLILLRIVLVLDTGSILSIK